MKKYAAIDWDDTLFDAHRLKMEADGLLERHGIDPVAALQTITEEVQKGNLSLDTYFPAWFAETLRRCGYMDGPTSSQILDEYRAMIKDSSRFFPYSSQVFVENLRRNLGIEPTILTYGDDEFQWEKIKNSGILKTIDPERIYVTQKDKVSFIKENLLPSLDGDLVYFINDKIGESKQIQDQLNIKSLLKVPTYVERNEGAHHAHHNLKEYEESGLPYFSDFSDMFFHIQRELNENKELHPPMEHLSMK